MAYPVLMMAMFGKHHYDNVIVVESPNIADQLQRMINLMTSANTLVTSTKGHLYDYKIAHNKITLSPISLNKIESIKLLDGQNIFIATDPYAQGELIAQHVKMLTPNSTHKRGYFNDLSEQGITRSILNINQGMNEFRDDIAVQATSLKLINLMLKESSKTYLTTTGITIAKALSSNSAVNKLNQVTVDHQSKIIHALIPTNDQINSVNTPAPLTTKDILKKELLKGNEDVMQGLQDSFEVAALSYIRTDSLELPPDSEHILQEFTCDTATMSKGCFSKKQDLPHYALHNIDTPLSYIEHEIAKHNRSALTGDGEVSMLTMESGVVYYAQNYAPAALELSPKQCIQLNLINSSDSFSSTIESASRKYAPLFFNGTHQNKGITNKILFMANLQCENILEKGIKVVLDEITKSKELVAELSNKEPILNKDISKPISEISIKSDALGEILDKMKVSRGMF